MTFWAILSMIGYDACARARPTCKQHGNAGEQSGTSEHDWLSLLTEWTYVALLPYPVKAGLVCVSVGCQDNTRRTPSTTTPEAFKCGAHYPEAFI
jgi:hypothetical protein